MLDYLILLAVALAALGVTRIGRGRGRRVYVVDERPRTPIIRTSALAAVIAGAQFLLTSWLPGTLPALAVLMLPGWYAAKAFVAPKVTGAPVSGVYVDGRDR